MGHPISRFYQALHSLPGGLSIAELLGVIKRHRSTMVVRPFIVALLSSVAVLRLAGAATPAVGATPPDKMSGLLSNSPFGTGKAGALSTNASGEAFEFRAVLEEGGSKFFSIYETSTRKSNWVELNDPVNGFSVKTYDAAKESITLDYQGRSLTLAIKRAPAVAQVMQPQPPQLQPGTNGGMPTIANPATSGVPTAIDQQRIQQIQEEIRRRRALRSQSMVPNNLNIPGAPPLPNSGNGSQSLPLPLPQPSNGTGPQMIPPRN